MGQILRRPMKGPDCGEIHRKARGGMGEGQFQVQEKEWVKRCSVRLGSDVSGVMMEEAELTVCYTGTWACTSKRNFGQSTAGRRALELTSKWPIKSGFCRKRVASNTRYISRIIYGNCLRVLVLGMMLLCMNFLVFFEILGALKRFLANLPTGLR